MLSAWVNYIRSYLEIEVDCPFHERFLNLCSRAGIYFWDAQKTERGIRFTVYRKDRKMVEQIAEKLALKMSVCSETGLYYLLKKYRGRYAFGAGAVAFLVAIFVLSSFVWSIDVIGCETITEEEVLYELKNLEVIPGTPASKIDSETLSEELKLRIPEISWVALNIKGSKLEVDLKERTPKPEIMDDETPSNLLASKDGLILSMEVASGMPQVKPGDVVKRGDILVSGAVESETKPTRYTPSSGRVYAKTWTKIDSKAPAFEEKRSYTGEEKTRYTLRLFDWNIPLYFGGDAPFEESERILSISELKLGENFYLPVGIQKERYLECTTERRELSYEEQLAICRERRDELFAATFPEAEVIDHLEETEQVEDGLVLHSEVVGREDIASWSELTVPEEPPEEAPEQ